MAAGRKKGRPDDPIRRDAPRLQLVHKDDVEDARDWLADLDFERGDREARTRDGLEIVEFWRHPGDLRTATVRKDGTIVLRDRYGEEPGTRRLPRIASGETVVRDVVECVRYPSQARQPGLDDVDEDEAELATGCDDSR